jgi:hypothetical protein
MTIDKTNPNWYLTNDTPYFDPGDRVRHLHPDPLEFPYLTEKRLEYYLGLRGAVVRADFPNCNCVQVKWDEGIEPAHTVWCGRDSLEGDEK